MGVVPVNDWLLDAVDCDVWLLTWEDGLIVLPWEDVLFAEVANGEGLADSSSFRLLMPSTASTSWKVARGAAATSPRREVRKMVECMANNVIKVKMGVFHVEGSWLQDCAYIADSRERLLVFARV